MRLSRLPLRAARRPSCARRRPCSEPLEPRVLLAVFTVTTSNPGGAGSLGQAIADANAAPGADTINFNIPGTGVKVISPASPLPAITDAVTIDGSTQPGYAQSPLVQLTGVRAPATASGLTVTGANNVVIRALTISHWGRAGINANAATRNLGVDRCWIGLDATGTAADGNGIGIAITGSSSRIGGIAQGARNVISGNTTGVLIGYESGQGRGAPPAADNVIAGNYIGTNAAGSAAVPNTRRGVWLSNLANDNVVGGTDVRARNVIAGNGTGVEINGTAFLPGSDVPLPINNQVQGNWIGLNGTGAALPNNVGVYVYSLNTVGGTAAGARNVISGNTAAGVQANTDAIVLGNWIGVDAAAGLRAVPNGVGIDVGVGGGAQGVTIGGPGPAARNVISGNTGPGVRINGFNVRVTGNYVGIDAPGRLPLGNGQAGVLVDSAFPPPPLAPPNIIGGDPARQGDNFITGNPVGVLITGRGASGTHVAGNSLGLYPGGASASTFRPDAGVRVTAGARDVVIGGATPEERNVISGNHNGVEVDGLANVVRGNFIGLARDGQGAVGNTGSGVWIKAPPAPDDSTSAIVVENNVISANGDGIRADGPNSGSHTIRGNFIGTNDGGNAALPNVNGIRLGAGISAVTITENTISGNRNYGIVLPQGSGNNTITRNVIGVADHVAGSTAVVITPPNTGYGIYLSGGAHGNAIEENIIAGNTKAGVWVESGAANRIRRNSIDGNGGLGIDLGVEGVAPNDLLDRDAGANDLQNFPIITGVYPTATGTFIAGTLNSLPQTGFAIDLYLSPQADPSGFGEGAEYLGTVTTSTDTAGDATFGIALTRNLPAGQVVTATATYPAALAGGTSEFSQAVSVPADDGKPPEVAQVYVRGTAWGADFLRAMEAAGRGSRRFGYAIPGGAAQLDTLPWSGLDQVSVRFTEPVEVAAGALTVRGVNVPSYATSSFNYDPARLTATWKLSPVPATDRLTLDLDGPAEREGAVLDGEWADGADAYPSGDGSAGGSFRCSVNTLTGDADRRGGRVNAQDLAEVKRHLNSTATGGGAVAYSVLADLDGNGTVNAQDLTLVRRNLNHSLPPAGPAPASAIPLSAPDAPATRRDGDTAMTQILLYV